MKTLEQKIQDRNNYLNKSVQHLFIVDTKTITKAITFVENDIQYYAKLEIVPNVTVRLKVYTNSGSMKWDIKQTLFPQYVKTKSIPYFKQMREIVKVVEAEIKNGDNKELIEKIKLLSKDIELIKE